MRFDAVMGKTVIVMEKTVRELMSLRRLAVAIIAGLVPPVLAALVWRESFLPGLMSLEMQAGTLVGYFLLISYIWIGGLYIAGVITISGIDLVSREEDEGTLLLMVSKPISRFQFILGKSLALLATTLLLELVVLFGSIVVFWGILGLDQEIVGAVVGLVPWVFLYSIMVAILFVTLTVAMSVLSKSRALKSVLTMLLVILIFGVGPIFRIAWPSTYENSRLYYVDPGYHLGNAFVSISNQTERGTMTPQIQAFLGIFTGAYTVGIGEAVLVMFTGSSESFDPDIGAMPPSLERADYVAPVLSVLLSLVVSAAALGATKVAMERKEVF